MPSNEINLDDYFRPDSKARKVAERLLTGKPATRQELVRDEVSITTVNRVVQVLEEAGANVLRDTDGRQAVFRVVSVSKPRRRVEYPQLEDEGTLMKDELVGGEHVLEVSMQSGRRYRGVLAGIAAPPPVGTDVLVAGVSRADHRDSTTVTLETKKGSKRIKLEATENITQ